MKKIIALFLICSFNSWGLNTFSHPSCDIYLNKSNLSSTELESLKNELIKKGYNFLTLNKEKTNLKAQSFYLNAKKTRTGKLYKECLVELEIFSNGTNKILSEDKAVYKNSSNRKFPRQTFEGNERCKLALQDLFFNINICEKIKAQ